MNKHVVFRMVQKLFKSHCEHNMTRTDTLTHIASSSAPVGAKNQAVVIVDECKKHKTASPAQ